jgi:hypothetical protein
MTEDILNKFGVSLVSTNAIALLNPPQAFQVLSKKEALMLAAWLVALADPQENQFNTIFEKVMNT